MTDLYIHCNNVGSPLAPFPLLSLFYNLFTYQPIPSDRHPYQLSCRNICLVRPIGWNLHMSQQRRENGDFPNGQHLWMEYPQVLNDCTIHIRNGSLLTIASHKQDSPTWPTTRQRLTMEGKKVELRFVCRPPKDEYEERKGSAKR